MKIAESNSVASNRYESASYCDEYEVKSSKKKRIFNLFLYASSVLFALAGIIVVSLYAVNLGVLVTLTASVCIGGWWAAYTLIVLHATNKEQ
jgi:hypothetical protein